MIYDLISFDVQGTLTEAAYCDTFWLSILPKAELSTLTKDDPNYYDPTSWLAEYFDGRGVQEVMAEAGHTPALIPAMADLVIELSTLTPRPILIATSSSTHSFIDHELGPLRQYLDDAYSTIEDLDTPGKPFSVFTTLNSIYRVSPKNCIHIGDRQKEDVDAPLAAGWRALLYTGDPQSIRAALLSD